MLVYISLITAVMGAVMLAGSPGTSQPVEYRCETSLGPGDIDSVRERLLGGAYDLPVSPQDTVYVPLTFHVVRTTQSQGGVPAARLCEALDDLDAFFGSVGIQFYLAGPLDFIDDDAFYYDIDTPAEIDALRSTNPVAGTINLYFTKHLVNQNGNEFCGISSFTWSPVQGIVMHNDCTAVWWNHTTLPHEMGHYFDLLHTHSTASGWECVDGSNCEAAGDLLCDTPADPVLGPDNVDADCTYAGTETDPCHNDPYAPDPANFMSGAPPLCRSSFSPQQSAKAVATLLNLRPELMHSELPVPYDCNKNGVRDDCDIAEETSSDCNANAIPDDCEPDCNDSGQPDDCDVADATSEDCNFNGVPDECEVTVPLTEQPEDQEADAGDFVLFSVETEVFLPAYQWRQDGADLQDDGRIIGSESATLFIFDIRASDGGVYDCLVTDTAGCFAISDPATLTVLGTCSADMNGDGVVGPFDLASVLGAWGPCPAEGDCPADLNADGTVGPIDLATLLAAWGPCG